MCFLLVDNDDSHTKHTYFIFNFYERIEQISRKLLDSRCFGRRWDCIIDHIGGQTTAEVQFPFT